jgi:hypothetical protein
MQKTLTLTANLATFLSLDLRKKVLDGKLDDLSSEETEELDKAKEFFSVEDVNTTKDFSVGLETFLWSLFEKIPAPESPLRIKAHERFLQEVASELDKSLNTEDLPKISDANLKKVVRFVEDPEEFKKMKVPFEFSSGDKKMSLPLPAVNVLQNDEFVTLLDDLFKNVTSLGE